MEMGFNVSVARAAVAAVGDEEGEAVQYCIDHSPAPEVVQPVRGLSALADGTDCLAMPPPVEPVTSFVSVGSSWVSETSSCNEPPAKQIMLSPPAAEKIPSDAIWLKASCGTKVWFPSAVLGKEAVAHFENEDFEKPTEISPHVVPFRVETIGWLKEACRKLSAHYHNAFHQLCAELIAQQGGVGQLCEGVQAAGYMMMPEVQNAILAYVNSSMRGCTTDQLVEKFGFVDDVDSVQKGQLCKEPLFTPPHTEDAEEPPSITGQLSEGLAYHLDAPFEDKLAESFDIRTLHTLKGCSLRWLQRARKALCIWRDKLYAANTPERLDKLMLQLQISSAAIATVIPGAAPAVCSVYVLHDQVAQELVTLLAPLEATRNSQMRRAYVQALCSLRSTQGECGWLLCVAGCLNDEVKNAWIRLVSSATSLATRTHTSSPLLLLCGAQSSTVREAVAEGLARYLGPVSSRVANSMRGLLRGHGKYPKILNG